MKRGLIFLLSVIAVISILVSGCGAPTTTTTTTTTTQTTTAPGLTLELIKSWPPLCEKQEIEEIDLLALADTIFALEEYSVFMSPLWEEVFGETTKDRAYLLRAARNSLFNYLGVSLDQIPQWAIDWVEEKITSGEYMYNYKTYPVFNRIYQELIKDPKYYYLKDPEQKEKLLTAMIEGMIKALGDPFAHYFNPDDWLLSEAGSGTLGRYRGLGIGISKNEQGEIIITNVNDGSPAEKAGLEPGDAILAVDGKSTFGCTRNQFIAHIKTRENPTMKLVIRKGLTDVLEEIKVTMEIIKQKHLFTYPGVDLPDNRGSTSDDFPFFAPIRGRDKDGHPEILYIVIKEFSVQMSQDLRYVLENLDMSQFEGIIIDIRDNPGGRVDAVLYSVDYFLPSDDLITTIKYGSGVTQEYRHNQWNLVPEDIPLVILVNKDSASGAELFPAALRDNGRAIIISKDERTAGKGSVNDYFTIKKGEYGALYISIGLWYTPSGDMIERQDLDADGYYEIGGLRPDIRVEWSDEDILENARNPAWYDPTIFRAIEYIGESGP